MSAGMITIEEHHRLMAEQRAGLYSQQQVEVLFALAMKKGMALLGRRDPSVALAAACVVFRRDSTLIGLSGSGGGRVATAVRQLDATTLRDDVMGSETVCISTSSMAGHTASGSRTRRS